MKKYTIGTVAKVAPEYHVWFERMNKGIQKFGQDTGHKTFLVGPPEGDEKLQKQVIEDVIAQGVDALCVVPVFPEALEWPLRKAQMQGTAVISHEASGLRNVNYNIEAFNNIEFGVSLMDQLAQYMGEKGHYAAFVGSLVAESHNEWAKAAIKRQTEKYLKMTLATRKIEDHDNPNIAYQKTKELIEHHQKLKGILAISMTATMGVGRAIEEKKLQNDIAVVGVSLASACKQHLLSGAIRSVSVWDPADSGYVMNKLAVMVLEGEKVTEGMDLGVSGYNNIKVRGKVLVGSARIDITKENMSNYRF